MSLIQAAPATKITLRALGLCPQARNWSTEEPATFPPYPLHSLEGCFVFRCLFFRCCFVLVVLCDPNEATYFTILQLTEGRPPGQWTLSHAATRLKKSQAVCIVFGFEFVLLFFNETTLSNCFAADRRATARTMETLSHAATRRKKCPCEFAVCKPSLWLAFWSWILNTSLIGAKMSADELN